MMSTPKLEEMGVSETPPNEMLLSMPRSSTSGYNLRPSEVLKRRLSAGKLKHACATTPRRKSTKPKGFSSLKKLADLRTNVLRFLEFGDATLHENLGSFDDEDSCSTTPSMIFDDTTERVSSPAIVCNLNFELEKHEEKSNADLSASMKKRLSGEFINSVSISEHPRIIVSPPQHQVHCTMGENITPTQDQNTTNNENRSGQLESFATPCMATPTLNTTFIKDETIGSEPRHVSVIDTFQEASLKARASKNERSMKRSFTRSDKENQNSPFKLCKTEPAVMNTKKAEFTINELFSSTNPEDIKFFAQIQQDMFPLHFSKSKLNMLLSEDSPNTPARSMNTTKIPTTTSKIPKLTRTNTKSALTNMTKSTTALQKPSIKVETQRPNTSKLITKWNTGKQLIQQSIAIDRRYRRHTLSSAAKIKQSQILPAPSTTVAPAPQGVQPTQPQHRKTTVAFTTFV